VLIPRPETELLVDAVLAHKSLWATARPAIADVGTGSGCVIISLALERPQGDYTASDISAEALCMAQSNATRLGGAAAKIVFLVADLLAGRPDHSLDGVVANLPYVRSAECDGLPRHIREHEPRLALDGGADGLDVIRRLIAQARTVLRPGGVLFLEIGHDQGPATRRLLEGFREVQICADYAGRERVVIAVLG
jgi:release factor glutamine methyltransferase